MHHNQYEKGMEYEFRGPASKSNDYLKGFYPKPNVVGASTIASPWTPVGAIPAAQLGSAESNGADSKHVDVGDMSDDDKDLSSADAEGVWSPDIEQSFQEALAIYPPCGRRKIILSDEGKMYDPDSHSEFFKELSSILASIPDSNPASIQKKNYSGHPDEEKWKRKALLGRNELIARYIKLRTGKTRTRKQVSSHIQVLARRKLRELQAKIKVDHNYKDKPYHAMSSMSSAQLVVSAVAASKNIVAFPHPPPPLPYPASPKPFRMGNRRKSSSPKPFHMQHMQHYQRPTPTTSIASTTTSPIASTTTSPIASTTTSPIGSTSQFAIPSTSRQANQFWQPGLQPSTSQDIKPFPQVPYPAGKPATAVSGEIEGGHPGQAAWEGRAIATHKFRLSEFSAYMDMQSDEIYHKHLFVHIGGKPSYSDPLLESVNISQISDKFPEKSGGLKDMFDRGPQNAFYLVKCWADLNTNITEDQGTFYGVTSQYESNDNVVITCSTKVCSFGKQVVEKVETEYSRLENSRFIYRINRSPMCEYMINFIQKLKHLPERYMMNSVLENFTILQVVSNKETQETLLCIAYVFEVAASNCGAQHHIYRLIKD